MRGEVVERRELDAARGTDELDHWWFQQRRGADAVLGRLRRGDHQRPGPRGSFRARFICVVHVVRLQRRRCRPGRAIVFLVRQKVLVLAEHYVAALAL